MQYSKTKILEQNNRLQALNIDLDKVIYNVSHDLRSPLAALTGLITLISMEDDPEEVKSLALMMQKSVDKQGQFINDILTSIKSNQRTAMHQKCDITKIIDDVLSLNNYTADGKKLDFLREMSITTVDCDAIKLKTILNNLISNAIKYSDKQKPYRWIKIKTYTLNAEWILEVEDNGIGIADKNQDKIFNKFFSEKETSGSSGIGLYLTKDAIEQMSGTIQVESQIAQGTKIIIKLPLYNN